jgi:hypothetical protein
MAFHGGNRKTWGKYWYFESHVRNSLPFTGATRSSIQVITILGMLRCD